MTGVTILKTVLAASEVIALLACVSFGFLWYKEPSGNYDFLFAISVFVLFVTELIRRYAFQRD